MNGKLNIAVISKADRSGGGAGKVADDLSTMLAERGHNVQRWLGREHEHSRTTRKLHGKRTAPIISLINKIQRKSGFPEFIPLEWPFLIPSLLNEKVDLLHFHDLNEAVSPFTLDLLSRYVPTIWTFHDCSPFTGGCINPLGCEKFHARCSDCPQFGTPEMNSVFDLSRLRQNVMRRLHSSGRITPVVPSVWMAEQFRLSGMSLRTPVYIPHAVNTGIFVPRNRAEIRRKFGLPTDSLIILLAANGISLRNPYKGFSAALKVIRALKSKSPFVLLVGQTDSEFLGELDGFRYFCSGHLNKEAEIAEYYSAADVFLNCTAADSFSLVTAEAASCGVPVAGFAVGGVPEIIENGRSGLLVRAGDVESLSRELLECIDSGKLGFMGETARKTVEERFSRNLFIERHLELYYRETERFKTGNSQ